MEKRTISFLILLEILMLGIIMRGHFFLLPLGLNEFFVLEVKAIALFLFAVLNAMMFYEIAKDRRWNLSHLFIFGLFALNMLFSLSIFIAGRVWLPVPWKYALIAINAFALIITSSYPRKAIRRERKKIEPVKEMKEAPLMQEAPKEKEDTIFDISQIEDLSSKKTGEESKVLNEEMSAEELLKECARIEEENKKSDNKEKEKNRFIASKNAKIFHREGCTLGKKIKARSKVSFSSPEEASDSGYEPCKRCMA
ncbi:MAG: hypothetical protein NTV63_00075 [Candidatus Woesearchaeota archaeon]|nr:hypothetical protein [Candidatus Woesearchaeota archaeon]